MKRWREFIRGYEWQVVLAPLFKLMEALFDLCVPLIVAYMIDHSGEKHIYIMCFGLLVGTSLLGVACSVSAQWFAARTAVRVSGRLRMFLFEHIGEMSAAQIDAIGPDTLLTRASSDVDQVQNGINMSLRLLLRSPFIVFGSMIMAFMLDKRSGWIFAAAILILSVVTFALMTWEVPLVKKARMYLDGMSRRVRQDLEGMRPIKAFGKQEEEREDFQHADRTLTKANEQSGFVSSCLDPVTYVIINLAIVVLLKNGAIHIAAGLLSQGTMVALYNYMAQIVVELVKLASLMVTINKSLVCAARVDKILQETGDMTYGTLTVRNGSEAVRFDHVGFACPKAGAPALEDISFILHSGETLGVIGPTGSGKSTLAALLARMYDCSSGQIRLFEEPIEAYSEEALHKMVGLVMQRSVMFSGPVRRGLCLGAVLDDECLLRAVHDAQADNVLKAKGQGLDSILAQGGRDLSGGQKQRLSIARALAHDPDILVLDDAGSALDYATDAALRKALTNRQGTTVIISQRVSSVRDADKILVLEDGRISGVGTHEWLCENCDAYREICAVQLREEAFHERKHG